MTSVVTITRVVLDQDLRSTHKLRDSVRCKAGQAWLFINAAETMARIVDSAHCVHCYWAPKGSLIDTAMLKEMAGALRLTLKVEGSPRKKMTILEGAREAA